ncbi:MAG: DUF3048 domain-containing protein [Nitriliruptorales bacterium]|nr:DUF3048 domain-containing protein [Nitriliruptorales bacterium]
MRPMLCAISVLVLLVAGCTRKPAAEPSETPTPTAAPSPEPTPVAALTGEELDEPIERPILAVKIDNASAALPPDGLEAADIVFEEEVEGGLTRFLALFHSDDPEDIGPVRSGREVDADLLPPFQPVLAFSGAAKPVKGLLRRAGVLFFEEGEPDKETFYRVPDRRSPHNLFAHTEQLWEAGEDLAVPGEPVFTFDKATPDGGRQTAGARVVYSNFANADWTWNDKQNRWERVQNGSPHTTAAGDTLTADNLVFMRIKSGQGGRSDSAGNPTIELRVIGKGQATVLRDGQRFRARWTKRSAEDPLELASQRDPLALRPGTTWIQFVDQDGELTFRRNAPEPGQ